MRFVYYFHAEPARFSGSEIVLAGPDGENVQVTPDNDTLVLFDPRTAHQVRRISCPSGRFENEAVRPHRLAAPPVQRPRQDAFFDRQVFTPVGRWVPRQVRGPHGPPVPPGRR